MSPSGASILITSAPRSVNRRVQCGPAIVVVKSSTRRPDRAPFIPFFSELEFRHRDREQPENVKPSQRPTPTCGLLLPGFGAKRAAASRGRSMMAFRNIQAGMATYRGHGGDRGDAYYAHPTNAGPHPGVVVIHHMPGWDEWTCEVARKFASRLCRD